MISQGARSHGHGQVAAVYDAVLGPLPAIAQRNVWIAIRFDPSRCAATRCADRGGGRERDLRTATTATRRVANRLTEVGLRPRVMTASEIAQATNQLTDGVDLTSVEETWRTCQEGRFQLRSFAVKPRCSPPRGSACCGRFRVTRPRCASRCAATDRTARSRSADWRGSTAHGRTRIAAARPRPICAGHQYSALACQPAAAAPPRRVEVGRWACRRPENADGTDFEHLARARVRLRAGDRRRRRTVARSRCPVRSADRPGRDLRHVCTWRSRPCCGRWHWGRTCLCAQPASDHVA